ncbi:Uncharacterised protein [Escherichia coli]|nr:Uncharacterised protein [Escherichia coli]CAD5759159.1 Uncharacterised protein [Escherichia coli]
MVNYRLISLALTHVLRVLPDRLTNRVDKLSHSTHPPILYPVNTYELFITNVAESYSWILMLENQEGK